MGLFPPQTNSVELVKLHIYFSTELYPQLENWERDDISDIGDIHHDRSSYTMISKSIRYLENVTSCEIYSLLTCEPDTVLHRKV